MKPIVMKIPGSEDIILPKYYPLLAKYYPNCELDTKRWFVKNTKSDWVIFDCGAHIGYYTILFARLVPDGKVYAFEPTDTVEWLKFNMKHNNVGSNVDVVNKALGAHNLGMVKDGIFKVWGKKAEVKEYDFTYIDDFVAQNNIDRIDAIKIDVDSYDFEVLQGAADTLVRLNPYVVVELNYALAERGQTVKQALKWLLQLGYTHTHILDKANYIMRLGYTGGQAIEDVIANLKPLKKK